MYITNDIKDIIVKHCIEEEDYIYIEKITYLNGTVSDLYLCVALYFRYDFERRIKYVDVLTVKDKSKATCINYVTNTDKKYIPLKESKTPGVHCLFIIKEIAFIVLENMLADELRCKVEDPRLASIYRSRKGVGKKLNVLEDNTFSITKEK